jgi:thioredoxin 1
MSKEITSDNFNEIVLQSKQPAIVDFWAQWCGPCKIVGPVIDELHRDYENKAIIGKLDVDAHQDIAVKYGIRSIPTILFFKDGQVVDKIRGAASKKELSGRLERLFGN